jgi:hypothetical protein
MATADFSTPLNTALLLYILFSAYRIVIPPLASHQPHSIPNEFKAGYTWMPRAHAPTVLFRTYTPRTLAQFDGRDGGRILLAIQGTVLTSRPGETFTGPVSHYTHTHADRPHSDVIRGQTACMATLRGATHHAAWRSSHSISVCGAFSRCWWRWLTRSRSAMLTPIDQPLDKLADLDPNQMCVLSSPSQTDFLFWLLFLADAPVLQAG